MSIYGLSVECFPELKRKVSYFNRIPDTTGTLGSLTDLKEIYVTFQNTRPKAVKDSNGNLVFAKGLRIRTNSQLQAGWFVSSEFIDLSLNDGSGIELNDGNSLSVNTDNMDIYRIIGESEYNFEGSLYTYDLEKVVGNAGQLIIDPDFNFGSGDLQ